MDELTALMSFLRKQPSLSDTSLAERRASYDRAEKAFPLPAGMVSQPWAADGLAGEHIAEQEAISGRTVLYLHGGGYGIGSPRSHRHLAAAIAQAAHADALLLDYRLAPEHPFPAALDDAVAAYRQVLKDTPAAQVAIAGDSAGGGLTVSTLVAARDAGLPMPAAAVCLSPWVDLTASLLLPPKNAEMADPLVKFDEIAAFASAYLGKTPATHPLASPLFADLCGLPPLLIHASNAEALASDSQRLASATRNAGVAATLEMTDGVPHVWHWFWPRLGLAREAIARVGGFLNQRLG